MAVLIDLSIDPSKPVITRTKKASSSKTDRKPAPAQETAKSESHTAPIARPHVKAMAPLTRSWASVASTSKSVRKEPTSPITQSVTAAMRTNMESTARSIDRDAATSATGSYPIVTRKNRGRKSKANTNSAHVKEETAKPVFGTNTIVNPDGTKPVASMIPLNDSTASKDNTKLAPTKQTAKPTQIANNTDNLNEKKEVASVKPTNKGATAKPAPAKDTTKSTIGTKSGDKKKVAARMEEKYPQDYPQPAMTQNNGTVPTDQPPVSADNSGKKAWKAMKNREQKVRAKEKKKAGAVIAAAAKSQTEAEAKVVEEKTVDTSKAELDTAKPVLPQIGNISHVNSSSSKPKTVRRFTKPDTTTLTVLIHSAGPPAGKKRQAHRKRMALKQKHSAQENISGNLEQDDMVGCAQETDRVGGCAESISSSSEHTQCTIASASDIGDDTTHGQVPDNVIVMAEADEIAMLPQSSSPIDRANDATTSSASSTHQQEVPFDFDDTNVDNGSATVQASDGASSDDQVSHASHGMLKAEDTTSDEAEIDDVQDAFVSLPQVDPETQDAAQIPGDTQVPSFTSEPTTTTIVAEEGETTFIAAVLPSFNDLSTGDEHFPAASVWPSAYAAPVDRHGTETEAFGANDGISELHEGVTVPLSSDLPALSAEAQQEDQKATEFNAATLPRFIGAEADGEEQFSAASVWPESYALPVDSVTEHDEQSEDAETVEDVSLTPEEVPATEFAVQDNHSQVIDDVIQNEQASGEVPCSEPTMQDNEDQLDDATVQEDNDQASGSVHTLLDLLQNVSDQLDDDFTDEDIVGASEEAQPSDSPAHDAHSNDILSPASGESLVLAQDHQLEVEEHAEGVLHLPESHHGNDQAKQGEPVVDDDESFEDFVNNAASRALSPIKKAKEHLQTLQTPDQTIVVQAAALSSSAVVNSKSKNLPSFPAGISQFNDPAQQSLIGQKATFDALMLKAAGSPSAVHPSEEVAETQHGTTEPAPEPVTVLRGVDELTPPNTPSSIRSDGPAQFDRALCEARNTFLGPFSLEDFIDTMHSGDDGLTNKVHVIEAFASLSVEEKEFMGMPVLHSTLASDLAYPLIQRRMKIGNTSLHAFLRDIPFDGGDTSILNVAEAFCKAATNDRFAPSPKMMGLLNLQAQSGGA